VHDHDRSRLAGEDQWRICTQSTELGGREQAWLRERRNAELEEEGETGRAGGILGKD
jgi:hypothetical protein